MTKWAGANSYRLIISDEAFNQLCGMRSGTTQTSGCTAAHKVAVDRHRKLKALKTTNFHRSISVFDSQYCIFKRLSSFFSVGIFCLANGDVRNGDYVFVEDGLSEIAPIIGLDREGILFISDQVKSLSIPVVIT